MKKLLRVYRNADDNAIPGHEDQTANAHGQVAAPVAVIEKPVSVSLFGDALPINQSLSEMSTPSVSMPVSDIRALNAARPIETIEMNLILSSLIEDENSPLNGWNTSAFMVSLSGPGQTEVPSYGTKARIRAVESAANHAETKDEFLQLKPGERTTSVQVVVYGHKLLPDVDALVADPEGTPKFVIGPEEELITFRVGLSHNNRSANPNMLSVSIMRKNNNSGSRVFSKTGATETNNTVQRSLDQFERAIVDFFEGIDMSRFEEGGDLAEAPAEAKESAVKLNASLLVIKSNLKEWKDNRPNRPGNNQTATKGTEADDAKATPTTPAAITDIDQLDTETIPA